MVVRVRVREGLSVFGNKNFEGRGMRWGFRNTLLMLLLTITSELKQDLTDMELRTHIDYSLRLTT